MSEKERQNASSILEVLDKLTAAKGEAYTEGLIAGILIGTANKAEQTAPGGDLRKGGSLG